MDGFLAGLNPAQEAAVSSHAAVLQVLAPPGSGKTKTLTTRVAYLIARRSLKPWNIIVCTFTIKAAKEMKERVKTLVGEKQAKRLQLGTFHSIALRYLSQFGDLIALPKDFGIADSADSKAIVGRIVKQLGALQTPGTIRSRISSQKAHGINGAQFMQSAKNNEQREFAEIFIEYEEALRVSKLLDYDDLLLRCVELLEKHPGCVSNIEMVLIDEFQDTNSIQFTLMKLFAQARNQITIVGDPDQSIYGFRAAEIQNLFKMKQCWPETMAVYLEENYRSSGGILQAAQKIIEQDTARPPKKLQATLSPGLRPISRSLPNATAEADWLVAEIIRLRGLSGNLLEFSDFAILLRAASLSRVIESALGKAGLPYRMVGGTRFYGRVEVKLLVDYLRVICLTDDDEAVTRIINVPSRKIGDASIKALQDSSRESSISLWQAVLDCAQGRSRSACKLSGPAQKGLEAFVNVILSIQHKLSTTIPEQFSLVDLVSLLIQKVGLQQWLKSKYADDYETRWANVEELIAQAADMSDPIRAQAMFRDQSLPGFEGPESLTTIDMRDMLRLFLSNIALSSSAEEASDKDGQKLQQVTISTIHAAKGLEWPVVFIPACYDGSIPHSRADDCDEERRLLYVGMTRAQALLYLSRPIKNTQKEETSVSPFLAQPGLNAFFEEHGPSIAQHTLAALATTLGRNCPSAERTLESRQRLKRDEDNYWPLNGELPLEERNQSSVYGESCQALPIELPKGGLVGFASVATRYDELMEKSRLQSIDRRRDDFTRLQKDRVVSTAKTQGSVGQATIASFFQGRSLSSNTTIGNATIPVATSNRMAATALPRSGSYKRPLQELTNLPNASLSPPSRRPRFAPTRAAGISIQHADERKESTYVFLSSSPTRPTNDSSVDIKSVETDLGRPGNEDRPLSRPAATFHTTSMQSLPGQRRTLGTRRSMQGWSARPMKPPRPGQ